MTSLSPTPPPTTLWATPSKEWVIQPRPKPGRKLKKDPSPVKDAPEVDAKVRRVQNRAAQRAFRERKQSQLAELQARIQSYEQGEIERNVALQSIAKRLKDENEQLRRENQLLKEKMESIEKERQSIQENEKKRARYSSPSVHPDSTLFPAKKKTKLDNDSPPSSSSFSQLPFSYIPSPSMASTPDSNGSSDTFSPLPYDPQPESPQASFNNLINFSATSIKPTDVDANNSFVAFSCGFCNEDTPCVCREIALQHAADRATLATFKSEDHPRERPTAEVSSDSILENLPPYQPPVPLRRKSRSSNISIFPTQPASSAPSSGKVATCSGDPSNCLACADDPFGKAFCSAIEETITARATCSDCPGRRSDRITDVSLKPSGSGSCCEGRFDCKRCTSSLASTMMEMDSTQKETIPTNEAWQQIKAHPNVAFADLSLLADVVVSRTSCSGPSVDISPMVTMDGVNSTNNSSSACASSAVAGLLTDPRSRYKERMHSAASPPPQLVPQEVLIQCGRRRVREVHADAVRDALRLLDAKFS
ncbi:hypothetical protein BDQ17DRAFT_1340727 [Cyathus striatus]|nr:hypothetical protein BDQ17DRAFT_1340727 [Cyathus striatus]